MSVDLQLPSGLVFRNAPEMLAAKFEEWPWEKYDGVPVLDWNSIGLSDIDRVYQLGARTPRVAYKQLLQDHGQSISNFLSSIPQIALEDESLELEAIRKPVIGLFDLVLGSKSVKLAGATKLISPFRPALLPVIDSVLENYYWYATSISNEATFRLLRNVNSRGSWGEYIFEIVKLMREDVRGALYAIDRVRSTCAGRPYEAISRVRLVESLVWYYYARG